MRDSKLRHALTWVCGGVLLATSVSLYAGPKGAKAIFDSGEGATIGMSVNAARPATPTAVAPAPERMAAAPAKYVGISYQILAIGDDGQMRSVNKNRIFRTGERVKILARTNRAGYLTVANIGSSGRMHVLYSEYVDAQRMTEIPPNSNLRFDGTPGTESILIMLSNEPSPLVAPGSARSGSVAAVAPQPQYAPPAPVAPVAPAPQYQPQGPSYAPPTPPVAMDVPSYPPMSPEQASTTMLASLDGAKSLKAKGAKDLMVEDNMKSSYAVVSPTQGFKAVSGGAKDLVMESSPDGMNYGVVPTSAMSGGGILTLEIKLSHR
jgi:hypothetical protein